MRIILCDVDTVCLKKYTWMLRSLKDTYNLDFHLEVCSSGEQLLFTYRSKNCMIPLKDISYLEVQNHKVFVHYKQEHFEIYDTLSNMEQRFSKHGFIRIHNSFMVSLNQISKLTTSSCLLRSGIILPVGRSYSKQAKEAFKIWSVEAL